MASVLANVDPNRPWYRRLTMIGVVLLGALQAAESTGAVPAGTSVAVTASLKTFAELLVVTGIYKHLAK